MKSLIVLFSMVCVLAGCSTTDEPTPVSWARRQAYLKSVQDPRLYGLSMVQVPGGVQIQGGGRLHYSQSYALEMLSEDPPLPVVTLNGRTKAEWPVLIDLTVPNSLFEFDAALGLKAHPVSAKDPQLVRLGNTEACLSLIPSLRFGQVFIENSLVLVQLKNGLSDAIARGVSEPRPRGIVGWDMLRKMGLIQFIYSAKMIVLQSTDGDYEPNPQNTLARLPLLKEARACAVQGVVDGKPVTVFIDPAGDFEVAVPQGQPISTLQFSDEFLFTNPSVAVSPGGVRIGARFLKHYRVTICPTQEMVYFEKRIAAEK
jgi:hypothetical protein